MPNLDTKELDAIFKLLNGDQTDKDDDGLCGQVKRNTYWSDEFRKLHDDIKDNIKSRQNMARLLWAITPTTIILLLKMLWELK